MVARPTSNLMTILPLEIAGQKWFFTHHHHYCKTNQNREKFPMLPSGHPSSISALKMIYFFPSVANAWIAPLRRKKKCWNIFHFYLIFTLATPTSTREKVYMEVHTHFPVLNMVYHFNVVCKNSSRGSLSSLKSVFKPYFPVLISRKLHFRLWTRVEQN